MVSASGLSRTNTADNDEDEMAGPPNSSLIGEQEAATNIQRIWRGHNSRDAAKARAEARQKRLREHIDRANMMEAVICIQTRMRIFLARARHNIEMRQRGAAIDIQRIWRGHHGRDAVLRRMEERQQRLKAHIERANMMEAVICIQTRMRIFLARIRLNIERRNRRTSPERAEMAPVSAKEPRSSSTPIRLSPPRTYTADEVDAASSIQRVWRGGHSRDMTRARAAQREERRREHRDRANMLEAVLLIQTRARILLARARRNCREEAKEHISPRYRVAQADAAAKEVQRIWRGHSTRDAVLRRMEERQQRLKAHIEKANLLEAVLVIQTRVRMYLARIRRNIRERIQEDILTPTGNEISDAEAAANNIQRIWRGHHGRAAVLRRMEERQQRLKAHIERANMMEAVLCIQTRMRIFLARARHAIELRHKAAAAAATKPTTTSGGGYVLSSSSSSAAAKTARPPNSRAGADTNAAASALRYSLTGRPGSAARHKTTRPNSEQQTHQLQLSQLQPHERTMYQLPVLPRSGFFIKSMEEAVVQQNASSPYHHNENQQARSRSTSPSKGDAPSPPSSSPSPPGSPANPDRVLATPESIAAFVTKLITWEQRNMRHKNNCISKHAALGALIEVFGGDKAPVIISTWENVTPFADCEYLSAEQLGLILMQIRTLKMLSSE